MRSKPITVMELYLSCKEEIEKWNWDKHVFTYDDDEWNWVHACWYLLDNRKSAKSYYVEDIERNWCKMSEVILLG